MNATNTANEKEANALLGRLSGSSDVPIVEQDRIHLSKVILGNAKRAERSDRQRHSCGRSDCGQWWW